MELGGGIGWWNLVVELGGGIGWKIPFFEFAQWNCLEALEISAIFHFSGYVFRFGVLLSVLRDLSDCIVLWVSRKRWWKNVSFCSRGAPVGGNSRGSVTFFSPLSNRFMTTKTVNVPERETPPAPLSPERDPGAVENADAANGGKLHVQFADGISPPTSPKKVRHFSNCLEATKFSRLQQIFGRICRKDISGHDYLDGKRANCLMNIHWITVWSNRQS